MAAPIYLVAESVGQGINIKVVGDSDRLFNAAFTLAISGGGNRSRHNGVANLRPGQRAILSSVTLASGGPWEARLRVEPADEAGYEQTLTAPGRSEEEGG